MNRFRFLAPLSLCLLSPVAHAQSEPFQVAFVGGSAPTATFNQVSPGVWDITINDEAGGQLDVTVTLKQLQTGSIGTLLINATDTAPTDGEANLVVRLSVTTSFNNDEIDACEEISTSPAAYETWLALNVINIFGNPGTVGLIRCSEIGVLQTSGDITGDIEVSVHRGNIGGSDNGTSIKSSHVTSISTAGDLLGDVIVNQGQLVSLNVGGNIGTASDPSDIRVMSQNFATTRHNLDVESLALFNCIGDCFADITTYEFRGTPKQGGSLGRVSIGGDYAGAIKSYWLGDIGDDAGGLDTPAISVGGVFTGRVLVDSTTTPDSDPGDDGYLSEAPIGLPQLTLVEMGSIAAGSDVQFFGPQGRHRFDIAGDVGGRVLIGQEGYLGTTTSSSDVASVDGVLVSIQGDVTQTGVIEIGGFSSLINEYTDCSGCTGGPSQELFYFEYAVPSAAPVVAVDGPMRR